MKACRRISIVFALLLSFTVLGVSLVLAEASTEAVLQEWLAEVRQYNQDTSFLSSWSQEDQNAMRQIMQKYKIIPREDEWSVAEDALSDAFAHFYGDGKRWTYVQKSEWDEARVYLGLTEELYYVIPDANCISEQEAYDAVLTKVLDSVSKGKMPGADLYIHSEDCLATTACILLDNEEVWWLQFYLSSDDLPFLSAYVWTDGRVYAEYVDKLSISYVYSAWQKERGFKKFAYWSLEDKAEFYQVLLSLWEREIELYGSLPTIARTVLSHKHSVPNENSLSEETVITISNRAVEPFIDLQGAVPVVYFYSDDIGQYVYQVNYLEHNKITFSVILNSSDGSILAITSQP